MLHMHKPVLIAQTWLLLQAVVAVLHSTISNRIFFVLCKFNIFANQTFDIVIDIPDHAASDIDNGSESVSEYQPSGTSEDDEERVEQRPKHEY